MIHPQPKPTLRRIIKGRKLRAEAKATRVTRAYIFKRDGYWCRCCLGRRAESMHEIHSRGAGGKRSKERDLYT